MAPTGSTGRVSSMATLTSFSDRNPTPRRSPRPDPPAPGPPASGASVGGGSRSMAAGGKCRCRAAGRGRWGWGSDGVRARVVPRHVTDWLRGDVGRHRHGGRDEIWLPFLGWIKRVELDSVGRTAWSVLAQKKQRLKGDNGLRHHVPCYANGLAH